MNPRYQPVAQIRRGLTVLVSCALGGLLAICVSFLMANGAILEPGFLQMGSVSLTVRMGLIHHPRLV